MPPSRRGTKTNEGHCLATGKLEALEEATRCLAIGTDVLISHDRAAWEDRIGVGTDKFNRRRLDNLAFVMLLIEGVATSRAELSKLSRMMRLVGRTPETPEHSGDTQEKGDLPYSGRLRWFTDSSIPNERLHGVAEKLDVYCLVRRDPGSAHLSCESYITGTTVPQGLNEHLFNITVVGTSRFDMKAVITAPWDFCTNMLVHAYPSRVEIEGGSVCVWKCTTANLREFPIHRFADHVRIVKLKLCARLLLSSRIVTATVATCIVDVPPVEGVDIYFTFDPSVDSPDTNASCNAPTSSTDFEASGVLHQGAGQTISAPDSRHEVPSRGLFAQPELPPTLGKAPSQNVDAPDTFHAECEEPSLNVSQSRERLSQPYDNTREILSHLDPHDDHLHDMHGQDPPSSIFVPQTLDTGNVLRHEPYALDDGRGFALVRNAVAPLTQSSTVPPPFQFFMPEGESGHSREADTAYTLSRTGALYHALSDVHSPIDWAALSQPFKSHTLHM